MNVTLPDQPEKRDAATTAVSVERRQEMGIQKGMPLSTSVGTDLVIEDLSDDVSGYLVTGFCSTAADYVIRTSRADGES